MIEGDINSLIQQEMEDEDKFYLIIFVSLMIVVYIIKIKNLFIQYVFILTFFLIFFPNNSVIYSNILFQLYNYKKLASLNRLVTNSVLGINLFLAIFFSGFKTRNIIPKDNVVLKGTVNLLSYVLFFSNIFLIYVSLHEVKQEKELKESIFNFQETNATNLVLL